MRSKQRGTGTTETYPGIIAFTHRTWWTANNVFQLFKLNEVISLAAKLILSTQQRTAAEQRATAKEWFVAFARQIEGKIDNADPNADRTRQAVRAVEECCGYGPNGGPKEEPDAIQQV